MLVRVNKHMQSSSTSWRGRSQGAAAEADTVGEQQLKRTQSGHSSAWPRDCAHQRCYCTRSVRAGGCARLTHLLRLLHHEELQVLDCSRRRTKGRLDRNTGQEYWTGILDWSTGLEYWTGILERNTGQEYWTGILDWNTGLEYWTGILEWPKLLYKAFFLIWQLSRKYLVASLTCSMPCLGILPGSLGVQRSLHI